MKDNSWEDCLLYYALIRCGVPLGQVFGDQAARLSELAKTVPGRVVASGRAVDAADPREAARWSIGEGVQLRGRSAPTLVAVPAV